MNSCHSFILVYAPYVKLMDAADSRDAFQVESDGFHVDFTGGALEQDQASTTDQRRRGLEYQKRNEHADSRVGVKAGVRLAFPNDSGGNNDAKTTKRIGQDVERDGEVAIIVVPMALSISMVFGADKRRLATT